MDDETQDVGLFISGNQAVVVGDDGAIEGFLRDLSVDPHTVEKARRGAIDSVAAAAGIASVAGSMSGRWVQLTEESFRQFQQLGGASKSITAGVIRRSNGQIAGHARFVPSNVNPLMMSNVATMAAVTAVRTAVADLQELVEAMDVKLDRLLSDNRAKALGDVQGVTAVLDRAYSLYESTGGVSATMWDQVAGHATSLAQSSSYALNQLDTIAESMRTGSTADRTAAMDHAASSELKSWLVILAACQANQTRLEAIEIIRLKGEDAPDVGAHWQSIQESVSRRSGLVRARVQHLADAVATTAGVSDFRRVLKPLRTRTVLNNSEQVILLLSQFAAVYGLEDVLMGEVERETWRKSFTDLVGQTTTAVTSTVGTVAGGVKSVRRVPPMNLRNLRAIGTNRLRGRKADLDDEPSEVE